MNFLKIFILFLVINISFGLYGQRPDLLPEDTTITETMATYTQELKGGIPTPRKMTFKYQKYFFAANVVPTPIGYTPPATGNWTIRVRYVEDPIGDVYYIDGLGRSLLVKDASAIQTLSISNDTISLTDGGEIVIPLADSSIFATKYDLDTLQTGDPNIVKSSNTADGNYTQSLGTTKQIFTSVGLANLLVMDGANGRLGLGESNPSYMLDIRKDQNNSTFLRIKNIDDGTAAKTGFVGTIGVNYKIQAILLGTSHSVSGINGPNVAQFTSDAPGISIFGGTNASSSIGLISGGSSGSNIRLAVSPDGKIGIGTTYSVFGGAQAFVHFAHQVSSTVGLSEFHRYSFYSSGTTSNGWGGYIRYDLESSTGFNRESMQDRLYWLSNINGAESSLYQKRLINNGTLVTVFSIDNEGFIKPEKGIIDSDGEYGTLNQRLAAKADGSSDWVNSDVNYDLTGDARVTPAFMTTTAGLATVSNGGCPFLNTDVGKTIIIHGAGTGTDGGLGDELTTTILSYQGACNVTLSSNATVSVSNKAAWIGTDNKAVLDAAFIDNHIVNFPDNNTTGKNYLVSGNVQLTGLRNTGLIGNNDTLLFVSANPNSYISGSEPNKNLFKVLGCDGVTFDGLVFKSIGQTFARVDTLDEGGYYSSLNGATIAYNRHYNKQANHGAGIDFQNTKNLTVTNNTFINCGTAARALGGGTPYAAQHLTFTNNKVYGWGGSAIYPCDFSEISGNYFDNEQAPVIDSNDINNDLGSSHVFYSASGYKEVNFHHNDLRYCRGTAVQWNTSSGRRCENNVVANNKFFECARAGSLIGNHEILQINLTGNTYKNTSRWLVSHLNGVFNFADENWTGQYSGNADYIGAYNLSSYRSVKISNSQYYDVDTTGNVATINASGHATIFDGDLTIENCYFDSLNNRAFQFLLGHDGIQGTITLKGNDFHAPIQLVGTVGAPTLLTDASGKDKFFILNNQFHVKNRDAITSRFGTTIKGNDFYLQDANYAISIDGIQGAGYTDILRNIFHSKGGTNAIELSSATSNNDSISIVDNIFMGSAQNTTNGNLWNVDVMNTYNEAVTIGGLAQSSTKLSVYGISSGTILKMLSSGGTNRFHFKDNGELRLYTYGTEDRTGNEEGILAVDADGIVTTYDITNDWVTCTNANSPLSLSEGDDFVKLDASSGNVVVTLLQGSQITGKIVRFIRTDATANTVTIISSTGSIFGSVSYTSQYDTGEMWSDGTDWFSHQ